MKIKYLLSSLSFLLLLYHFSAIADQSVESFSDGDIISMDGYVDSVPRFYSGDGGKYQSWSFNLSAQPRERGGPQHEYILVTYHTMKWGKSIGDWPNYKQGDKVTLKGRFAKAKEKFSSGLLGSFYVNDKSIKEVNP